MNKDEALKMVIDAWDSEGNFKEAIQACKEALATNEESLVVQPTIKESLNVEQPAQEPSKLEMAGFDLDGVIADGYREGLDNVSLSTIKRVRKTISDYVAQPAQEPVAVCKDSIVNWVNGKAIDGWLYTHPAPEVTLAPDATQWHSLSDDEKKKIWFNLEHEIGENIVFGGKLADAIEQELKHKNGF